MPLLIDSVSGAGTITLLVLKSDFWRHQGLHWSGTTSSGQTATTASLTDTALQNVTSGFPTPLTRRQIRLTSGGASGDLRLVAKVDATEGTIFPHRPFSNALTAGGTDTYELWGNGIDGGLPLTTLFNDVLRTLSPLTQTQVPIVTGQKVYDLSTLVEVPDEVLEVYVRHLDPASLTPYEPVPISWYKPYLLGGAGSPTVKIEIAPSLTLTSPETVQLWVEHWTTFGAFTADTQSVSSLYRDWIVWETLLEYASHQARRGGGTDDRGWKRLLEDAAARVRTFRERHTPHRPIRLLPERPS